MTSPIPSERRLAKLLGELARRLSKLEAGQRATQLGYSSIQDAYIRAYDSQSQVRMLLGRQHDGTFAVSYQNGPKPARPAGVVVGARQLAAIVGWDGTFEGGVAAPGDLARVDVHVSEDGPEFVPDGTTVVGQLLAEGSLTVGIDSVTHYVKLVAVTTSDIASDPTEAFEILPLPAGQLAAGVVGAEQLAAEIVLASRIILGDPNAERLEIDENGIAQYAATGSETLRIGAGPTTTSFLTIVDPTEPDRALASINSDGIITAQGFSVNGDLNVGGEPVQTLIDQRSRGMVGWAQVPPMSGPDLTIHSTTEQGIAELAWTLFPGRMYAWHTNGVVARGAPCDLRARWEAGGGTPTISSPLATVAATPEGMSGSLHGCINGDDFTTDEENGIIYRQLISIVTLSGAVAWAETWGTSKFQFWAEDIGPSRAPTGHASSGGGATAPPPVRRTTTWHCTWSGSWRGDGSLRHGNGGDMVQGYYDSFNGDNHAAFGFDDANIRATIAGATIHDVGIYLYAKHWYYNSGGWARIRSHNGGPTGTYPAVSGTRWAVHMGKPQGLWISLGAGVGYELMNGSTRGFALDARDVARNLVDYGKFDGQGQAGHPILAIDYTK